VADPGVCASGANRGSGVVHPAGVQGTESPPRVWDEDPPGTAVLSILCNVKSVFVNTKI